MLEQDSVSFGIFLVGFLSTDSLNIFGTGKDNRTLLENWKRKADNEILAELAEALKVSVDRLTGDSVSCIIENKLEDLDISLDRLISHNEDKETYPDIYPDDVPICVVGEVLGKI